MGGHSARVGTLAWKRHVLSSGSRDSSILQHDVRIPNHKVATFAGHEQEVSHIPLDADRINGVTWTRSGDLCTARELWERTLSLAAMFVCFDHFRRMLRQAHDRKPSFLETAKDTSFTPLTAKLLLS